MTIKTRKAILMEETVDLHESVSEVVSLVENHQGTVEFTPHQQMELNDELVAYFDAMQSICHVLGEPLSAYPDPDLEQRDYWGHFVPELTTAFSVAGETLNVVKGMSEDIDDQRYFWVTERLDDAVEAITVLRDAVPR